MAQLTTIHTRTHSPARTLANGLLVARARALCHAGCAQHRQQRAVPAWRVLPGRFCLASAVPGRHLWRHGGASRRQRLRHLRRGLALPGARRHGPHGAVPCGLCRSGGQRGCDAGVRRRSSVPRRCGCAGALRRRLIRRRRRARRLQALPAARLLRRRRRDAGAVPRRLLLPGQHDGARAVAVPGVDVFQRQRARVGRRVHAVQPGQLLRVARADGAVGRLRRGLLVCRVGI